MKCGKCKLNMTLITVQTVNKGKPGEYKIKHYQCQNSECDDCGVIIKEKLS